MEGGQNKNMKAGAWNQGAQPGKSPVVTEPEMSRCPPLRAVSIHVAVLQLRAPHAKTNAIIT
jgi:hypothetical protein